MGVEIILPGGATNKFVEGPKGYFTVPVGVIETPPGSGLYDIPGYLIPSGDGLYEIPADMLGSPVEPISNIVSFSVQEDATPIEPGNTFGGVGQINVVIDDFRDAPRLIGGIVLADGTRGKTSGTVRSMNAPDGVLTITADSVLGRFNTERTARPLNTTLGNAIQYYCDLVGIENDVIVDTSLASRPVVYPGWVGNAWVYMKNLLSKEQVEMALVFNRIYVRPLRQLVANLDKQSSTGWSLDNSVAAKNIEIYYYNHVYGGQQEIYPVAGQEPSMYTVNAGETVTFTQQLNASMLSVNQPVAVDFVNNTSYAGTDGVYAVSGNDGLPIPAAQWIAQGGSVVVSLTDDPSVIDVTITGASMTNYAPYRIAMTSGSSNYYNSLHITGTGVVWDKKLLTLPTGCTETSVDVGTTVDNPHVSTLSQAYSLGGKTAQAYAGINYRLSGTAFDINRNGQGRNVIQATISDFNNEVPAGTTIATFNLEWSGNTIADFNEYWQNQVDLIWPNQLFGNAPGARVLTDDVNFRVISATTTESAVQFEANLDTLVSDFSEVWNGETIADFNASLVGSTLKDFSVAPLRRN